MLDRRRLEFGVVAGYDAAQRAAPDLQQTVGRGGAAGQGGCPVYALHGAQDPLIPPSQVDKLRAALRHHPDVTFDIPEDGDHCCHNLYHVVRPRMADWLAERLGSVPLA